MWTYTFGAVLNSSVVVANGVVYVGAEDGNIYALDATSGNYLWSYVTGGLIDSSPAVADGVVYVGSTDGRVYAFDQFGGTGASGNVGLQRPDPAHLIPNYGLVPLRE